jgi:hypothetical protein
VVARQRCAEAHTDFARVVELQPGSEQASRAQKSLEHCESTLRRQAGEGPAAGVGAAAAAATGYPAATGFPADGRARHPRPAVVAAVGDGGWEAQEAFARANRLRSTANREFELGRYRLRDTSMLIESLD